MTSRSGPRCAISGGLTAIALGMAHAGEPPETAPMPEPAGEIYPVGDEFALGLYSLHGDDAMIETRQSGWNIAHRYSGYDRAYVDQAERFGFRSLGNLPGESRVPSEDELRDSIGGLATSEAIAWWDLPEERRYWVPEEMQLIRDSSMLAHEIDPRRRPRMMYIPGHYDADAVSRYVPYIDIVPASVYTTFQERPHAWVRWRMEETIKGIEDAGATIGADHLDNEKTVIAALELFYDGEGPAMTGDGAYHDFWASIASGAKGVLVFSHFYRDDTTGVREAWVRYNQATEELTGSEGFDDAVLFGDVLDGVGFELVDGPDRTEAFLPSVLHEETVDFPSITVRALERHGNVYVIAVNSTTQAVRYRLTGLPEDAGALRFPFDDSHDTQPSSLLQLEPLGVHLMILGDLGRDSE